MKTVNMTDDDLPIRSGDHPHDILNFVNGASGCDVIYHPRSGCPGIVWQETTPSEEFITSSDMMSPHTFCSRNKWMINSKPPPPLTALIRRTGSESMASSGYKSENKSRSIYQLNTGCGDLRTCIMPDPSPGAWFWETSRI